MKIIKHYCDKCGKEVPTNDLVLYEVRCKFVSIPTAPSMIGSVEICRDCSVVNGYIKAGTTSGVKPPDPPPTLEQRLYDILDEMVKDVLDNR